MSPIFTDLCSVSSVESVVLIIATTDIATIAKRSVAPFVQLDWTPVPGFLGIPLGDGFTLKGTMSLICTDFFLSLPQRC